MHYAEHAPPPALAGLVDCVWSLEPASEDRPRAQRVLPDGCMDVVFDLGERDGALVVGAMTRALVTAPPRGAVVGVRFLPGAALRLLGIAGRELRDASAPAGDALGAAGRELSERVLGAPSVAAAVAVLASELQARAGRARPPDRRLRASIEALRATRGRVAVRDLAAHVGLGDRQLERLFDEHVGLGPRVLGRVMRLQGAVRAMAAEPVRPSGATLAAAAGYADQAHMIREFRALAGVTPGELAAARAMSDPFNPPLGPVPILGA